MLRFAFKPCVVKPAIRHPTRDPSQLFTLLQTLVPGPCTNTRTQQLQDKQQERTKTRLANAEFRHLAPARKIRFSACSDGYPSESYGRSGLLAMRIQRHSNVDGYRLGPGIMPGRHCTLHLEIILKSKSMRRRVCKVDHPCHVFSWLSEST